MNAPKYDGPNRRYDGPEKRTSLFRISAASLSIVGGLLLNFGTFVWFASKMNSDIEDHEKRITSLNFWRDKQGDDITHILAHIAVMDERSSQEKDILNRLDERTEKLIYKK